MVICFDFDPTTEDTPIVDNDPRLSAKIKLTDSQRHGKCIHHEMGGPEPSNLSYCKDSASEKLCKTCFPRIRHTKDLSSAANAPASPGLKRETKLMLRPAPSGGKKAD